MNYIFRFKDKYFRSEGLTIALTVRVFFLLLDTCNGEFLFWMLLLKQHDCPKQFFTVKREISCGRSSH